MGSDAKWKKVRVEVDDPLESGVIPTVIPPDGAMREPIDTFVDDEVTEQARLASVLIDSTPPSAGSADDPRVIRARLSPLDRVPTRAKSIDELPDDLKEPKTAFVLGFVDGVLPLETIIEVTGLPEVDTLRIVDRLIAQGAIVFPKRR